MSTTTHVPLPPIAGGAGRMAGVAGGALLLGVLIAVAPWLAAGLLLGGGLFTLILVRPLWVVGAMLAIGPIDLSFLTGGYKALFEEMSGGLDMNGIRLVGVASGLVLLAALEPEVRRRAFGRYGLPFLVFLAWCAFTLTWSPAPLDGVRLLFKLAYPLLFFVAVLGATRERGQLDRLIDVTLVGAAVITILLNPIFYLAGGYEVDLEGRVRAWGVGVHQNPFSFYLLLMLLLSLMRFTARHQVRYLVLCGVICGWMILTLTRSTFLTALLALGGIAVHSAVVSRNWRLLTGAVVLGVLVAVGLMPAFLERTFYGDVPTPSELLALLRDPIGFFQVVRLSGREVLWGVVYAAFIGAPWLGLGLGATTAVLQERFPVTVGHVVHNEYLRLGAEAGIVGVVLIALALLPWWIGVFRAAARPEAEARQLALPAIAALLAYAVISLSDNTFDYYAAFSQYVGFLAAAAIAAARFAEADDAGETT